MNCSHQHPGLGGLSLWASGLLPSAHLLDGTWWFDRRTVEFFRTRFDELPASGQIVFLGTPSLFVDASVWSPARKTMLFDRDEAIRECLPEDLAARFVTADLTVSVPARIGADLVVADPPWYPQELKAFLVSAQAVARLGAEVQLCIPPIGTRPGIEFEREDLFAWAAAGGLTLIKILSGEVRYDTPPFERNVLRSAGEQIEDNWRNGDIAVFAVDRIEGLEREEQISPSQWADVRLLKTRWRVAEKLQVEGDPTLICMGFSEDIFPSCSRRHADRSLPAVWTSGNRAFLCSNPQGFLEILQSLRGNTLDEIARRARELYPNMGSSQAKAAAQILTLIHVEQQEVEALQRCLNGSGQ